jgi:hypothetical protein
MSFHGRRLALTNVNFATVFFGESFSLEKLDRAYQSLGLPQRLSRPERLSRTVAERR